MGRGFTFFDVIFTLLLVAVIGMIAVPGALDRLRIADEVRAIEALQWIAAAQEHYRLGAHHDADGDGQGEYGFLADLVRTAPRGGDWGDCPFDGETGFDTVRLPGFQLAVFLPGPKGEPLTPVSEATVEPDFAEKTFAAIAWPTEAGATGYRAYYVNHDLLVLEHLNAKRRFSGPTLPKLPVPVLASRHKESGSIMSPPSPSSKWTIFLRREQQALLEKRVGIEFSK
jgi:type II secretory pathway pseudopilin PulG